MAKLKGNPRQLVLLALFVAQALVLSIVESWIPVPVNVPGIKLGLANIIILVVIAFFDFKSAFIVMVLRTFLAALFTGGMMVFAFSAAGGILSTVVMSVLYYKFSKSFSLTGISIAGAIAHNIGQLAAASILMKDAAVLSYLPVLMASGIVTGFFIGTCTNFLSKSLKKTKLFD